MGMIKFFKHYDKSSPYLKKALFENKALDEVVFSARRTIDGETSDYLVVTLTDASIMEYDMRQAQDEPDLIEEEVSFAYKKIKFVYDKDDEIEMDVYVGK
ncbi:MAG: type VI secretion system tube protein Hcp, partial [Mesorhizobium sp.]